MLANQWKNNAFAVMNKIEETQMEKIKEVATIMADTIEAGRWVHTFGCGHANLPIEEMYPRIGGFVGFHPLCELPLTFFTHIVGEMGILTNSFSWNVPKVMVRLLWKAGTLMKRTCCGSSLILVSMR